MLQFNFYQHSKFETTFFKLWGLVTEICKRIPVLHSFDFSNLIARAGNYFSPSATGIHG
jgi:hypothetical protein